MTPRWKLNVIDAAVTIHGTPEEPAQLYCLDGITPWSKVRQDTVLRAPLIGSQAFPDGHTVGWTGVVDGTNGPVVAVLNSDLASGS